MNFSCPSSCSGTPAATYGCSDGTSTAEEQIGILIEEQGKEQTRAILNMLSSTSVAKDKMKPYFDKPTKEKGATLYKPP